MSDSLEQKRALERGRALQGIQMAAATLNGRALLKHLFILFEVGKLPPAGLKNEYLLDMLGELRSGRKFFSLVSQADPTLAASILAEIEKEQNDEMALQTVDDFRRD